MRWLSQKALAQKAVWQKLYGKATGLQQRKGGQYALFWRKGKVFLAAMVL